MTIHALTDAGLLEQSSNHSDKSPTTRIGTQHAWMYRNLTQSANAVQWYYHIT